MTPRYPIYIISKGRWKSRLTSKALEKMTVLFYAFQADKIASMRMKGGNTDTVYRDSQNRLEFARSLQDQHPDCVKIVWKYNRWHHEVDYSRFRHNKLIKRDDIDIPQGVNNYGMKLVSPHDDYDI